MDQSRKTVAVYARVSSQRQADELTIASQVAAIRQRVEQDQLLLEESRCFLDEGYTGSSLVRPALERVRDLAHCGAVDRVYIHSPDRLARKYVHQMLLLEEFSRQGVEVVFLNDIHEHESPEGTLLLQMQGMIAEYERAKTWNGRVAAGVMPPDRDGSACSAMRRTAIATSPSPRETARRATT